MTKQERRRWSDYPMSFDVSQEDIIERAKYRRAGERQVRMCASCGACVIIGNSRLTLAKKADEQGGLFYCDAECADEHRRWRYITDEYKDLRYGDRRRYPSTNVKYANCRVCGCLIASATGRTMCGDTCRKKHLAVTETKRRFDAEWNGTFQTYSTEMECERCGVRFTHIRRHKKRFCSVACAKNARKLNDRHRKRMKSGAEAIDRRSLFAAARWKCKSCGIRTHWPDGSNRHDEATVDHVVPLSKGGLHTRSNVQLLCRRCNSDKRDTIDRPMQLELPMAPAPLHPLPGGRTFSRSVELTTAAHRGVSVRQKIGLSKLGGSADGRD